MQFEFLEGSNFKLLVIIIYMKTKVVSNSILFVFLILSMIFCYNFIYSPFIDNDIFFNRILKIISKFGLSYLELPFIYMILFIFSNIFSYLYASFFHILKVLCICVLLFTYFRSFQLSLIYMFFFSFIFK